jgi:hypothetical protein
LPGDSDLVSECGQLRILLKCFRQETLQEHGRPFGVCRCLVLVRSIVHLRTKIDGRLYQGRNKERRDYSANTTSHLNLLFRKAARGHTSARKNFDGSDRD